MWTRPDVCRSRPSPCVHPPSWLCWVILSAGAVTAVAEAVQGKGHALERNIPPLVAPIKPAVTRAMTLHPQAKGEAIIPYCVEGNIWQAIEDLFMKSPAVRHLVATKGPVVGAIYDVGTGKVNWLPESKVGEILKKVSESLNGL